MYVGKKIIKVEYRITHYLPGPVIGYIAAAVGLVKSGALTRQLFFIEKQVLHITAFSYRIYMRMLDKQKIIRGFQRKRFAPVAYLKVKDPGKQRLLVFPGFLVIFKSKITEYN